MNFLKRLFGKPVESHKETDVVLYSEKDNLGTRHDTESKASSYWIGRIAVNNNDPFVMYFFDNEKDAQESLLELPCIHIANDSGKLICTEVLIFGYYQTKEGKYEAIICGSDLTQELWEQAKSSFKKHGGQPLGQGELEPEKRDVHSKSKESAPKKVVFVKEEKQVKMGATFIYRIHKAPDAISAQAFLQQNPVTQKLVYLIVETPEGNYCRDVDGIYKE